MLFQTQAIWKYLRARYIDPFVPGEEGSAVETVIITAIFALMALTIGGVIMAKVLAKANSINLN